MSLFLLVMSFVVYASFLKPEYKSVNTLRGTIAAKENLLESQRAILNRVQELLAKYQGSTRIQSTVSFALPNDPNAHFLFYQLLGLVKLKSLKLDSLGLSQSTPLRSGESGGEPTAALPRIGTIQASISVGGSYEDFKQFLQLLETNIRIIDVVSFAVAAETQGREQGRGERGGAPQAPEVPAPSASYGYSLVVKAYYQSE